MKRILLGALIGASALAAIPTAANAATTCTFDSASAARSALWRRRHPRDRAQRVRAGVSAPGPLAPSSNCFSATGVLSTAANTDKVTIARVQLDHAANDADHDHRREPAATSPASNPNLAFFVLTGIGRDRLIVNETSAPIRSASRTRAGTLAVGPAVDLDWTATSTSA